MNRTDEFRCYDERLVEILPGREMEAVALANELRGKGLCDGLCVIGEDVVDWRFLESVADFNRMEFVRVNGSFRGIDFSLLNNVESLRIGSIKCDINFVGFSHMERLECEWSERVAGLDTLENLVELSISGISVKNKFFPLMIPDRLERFRVVSCSGQDLFLGSPNHSFGRFEISHARSLRRIPPMNSVESVGLEKVGGDYFDYLSIPSTIKSLYITSCAPITSWDFMESLPSLESLVIYKTKCAPMPEHRRAGLKNIDMFSTG
jgi:hypothetical protein